MLHRIKQWHYRTTGHILSMLQRKFLATSIATICSSKGKSGLQKVTVHSKPFWYRLTRMNKNANYCIHFFKYFRTHCFNGHEQVKQIFLKKGHN